MRATPINKTNYQVVKKERFKSGGDYQIKMDDPAQSLKNAGSFPSENLFVQQVLTYLEGYQLRERATPTLPQLDNYVAQAHTSSNLRIFVPWSNLYDDTLVAKIITDLENKNYPTEWNITHNQSRKPLVGEPGDAEKVVDTFSVSLQAGASYESASGAKTIDLIFIGERDFAQEKWAAERSINLSPLR